MMWKTSTLSEVARIGDGAHASLKRTSSGIPYLTAKNITKSGVDYTSVEYISEETYNKHFKVKSNALTQPQKDDILYSIIGSIGGIYVVRDEKVGISSSVAIFRADTDTILPQYLAYFLKSPAFDAQIQAIKGGVAQGFMSLGKLGSVEIIYPNDLQCQERAVRVLSAYDDLIENNQKQIKLLEEAAQRLYKEWFVDLRFPGHEITPITDGIPVGWIEGTLADLVQFKRGKTITKGQVNEGNIPVVAGGLEPAYYHDTPNTDAPVITVSGSGANAGFTRMYHTKVWASDCSYVDISTTADIAWVYCFLKENKASIDSMQKGAAQPHVYAKDLNAMKMVVPCSSIMEQFRAMADPMFARIGKLEEQIKLLVEARDRLLPKLMNGEIEV